MMKTPAPLLFRVAGSAEWAGWRSLSAALMALSVLGFLFAAAPAQAAEPSTQDMIEALRPKPADGMRTRSLAGAPATQGGQLELRVQFDFDSARVSPASQDLLRKLAAAMKSPALQGSRFLVEGHTDAVGAPGYNLDLSARRAGSVREVLVAEGVDTALLRTEGKGSTQPADAANPRSAINRRVRIVSIPPAGAQTGRPGAPTGPATAAVLAPNAAPTAAPTAAQAGAPAKVPAKSAAMPASPSTAEAAGDEPREAGRVLKVQGQALLGRTREGADKDIEVSEATVVMEGDRIQTGPDATVLVGLNDGARMLVRPGTSVSISESGLSAKLKALSQKVDLLVGAIRFITGDIGKRNPAGVRLKTPTLTIGIRGTDIELNHQIRTRSGAPAGSYVRVNTGAVALAGVDGSAFDLGAGEQGFGAAQGVRMRGGAVQPAARKLESPVDLFPPAAADDALLGGK